MAKKTQPEIDAEIRKLTACKAYAPRYQMGGVDNHEIIDEQIGALANRMTEDQAYDKWGDEGCEETFDQDILDAVLEALRWRDGNSTDVPSSGWDIYKPKKKK